MEINRIYDDTLQQVIPLFDAYRVFYGQPSDLRRSGRFLRARVGSGESVLFAAVLENGQAPAGFTHLYPIYSSVRTVKNWLLNDLFVDQAFRRRGIGEALIRRAMDFAHTEGASVIRLETAVTNVTAQRLYERLGFRKKAPDAAFFTYENALR